MAIVKVTRQMADEAVKNTDWAAQDALTDEEIERRVATDPDTAPITAGPEVTAARVRWIREKTGLAQPAFATRFGIPVGTLRDWEQGRVVPDNAARTLLRVIELEPDAVARAVAA